MKKGDLVKVVLTGEVGMVVEVFEDSKQGFEKGYLVRLNNYSVIKFFEFELVKR